jgi:uncharacterized protein YyaL (SSP411 family)
LNKTGLNRLANEKSPYLLQHADNPVDWYPWGEEAFERAASENKPIFLSIGYSSCHWCHVMEQESFSDAEVARLLNKTFVCVKVDREERPDIDNYYMKACQVMSGTGGWPLTIIMTHEKKPFFAATYIPKMSRFGRNGLLQLIPQVQEIWRTSREHIEKSSDDIAGLVQESMVPKSGEITEEVLHAAYEGLLSSFDHKSGGFGNAPKFPSPQNLFFLMRYGLSTGQKKALDIVEHTLSAMRMGGIYDHIGYGFHRYSTDADWRLPHFEKMLYDQALLTMVYTEAFQCTQKPIYRTVAQDTLEYVLREMTSPHGSFYSAEDADSEGQEGKFYTWEQREIQGILGAEQAALFGRIYNIEAGGNYIEEAEQKKTGRNILYMKKQPGELALEMGIPQEKLDQLLAAARFKLYTYRQKRIHPHKDEKVLCDWNGLMIAALSKAGRIFANRRYVQAASEAAGFLLTTMRGPDGMLRHRFMDGDSAITGFLDDYAFLIWGLIELYEASFKTEYLQAAIELYDRTMLMFWDNTRGAFFFTPENNGLPSRTKEIYDGAIPSGNSVAMMSMLRLARLTGRHEFEQTSNDIMHHFAGQIQKNPLGHLQTLIALNYAYSPGLEIVISGNPAAPRTQDFLDIINSSTALDMSVILRPSEGTSQIVKLAPFTEHLLPKNRATTVYLCQKHACAEPINDPAELRKKLPMLLGRVNTMAHTLSKYSDKED